MKLLFDQHISFRVVRSVADVFPEARHTRFYHLEQATDDAIWDFASSHGYVIVTKDNDFYQKSLLLGHPPKVVWLKFGNSGNSPLEAFIRSHVSQIEAFVENDEASLLVLSSD